MSSYPPPPPPRRLTRSRTTKMVGGVCGGIAHYLNMDPTLVRILAVILTLVTSGAAAVAYVVALFVMPEEDDRGPRPPGVDAGWNPSYPQQWGQDQATTYDPTSGGPSRQYDGAAGTGKDPVWGPTGAPWEQPQPQPSPGPGPRPQAPDQP